MQTETEELPELEDPFEAAWKYAWKNNKQDRREIWEWAEDSIPEIPYSPIPGRLHTTKLMREALNLLNDPAHKVILIAGAIQTSKSLILELFLSNQMANNAGPSMWINQDDAEAGDQSTTRLYPLFDAIPELSGLMPQKHKRSKNFIQLTNGAPLWTLGANIGNLQRRSLKLILGDEAWLWGDGFIKEAIARTTKYPFSKAIFASQGGEECEFHSRIDKSKQYDWGFTCPHCGTWQNFDWNYVGGYLEGREGLSWSHCKKEDGLTYDWDAVKKCTVLKCQNEKCGHNFRDSTATRKKLEKAGSFGLVQDGPAQEITLHWNNLYCESWGDTAVEYLQAKRAIKQGDSNPLRIWTQKKMANKWTDEPEDFQINLAVSGYNMGEPWEEEGGIVIGKGGMSIIARPFPENKKVHPLRVMTIDMQRDHFFTTVASINPDGQVRVIFAKGGLGADGVHNWEDLEMIRQEYGVMPGLVFLDSGYNSNDAYNACARFGWVALKGEDRSTFAHTSRDKNGQSVTVHRFYSPVRKIPLSANLVCKQHFFSVLACKDTVARSLANGYWTLPDDAPDFMREALESERRDVKGKKPMWVQIGKRANHGWDCLSMLAAVLYMLKINGEADESGE